MWQLSKTENVKKKKNQKLTKLKSWKWDKLNNYVTKLTDSKYNNSKTPNGTKLNSKCDT